MNTCTKVFLRKKAISGGRISLYLDFYPAIRNPHTNRMSRRETLGIYIYASPKNEREKQFNASMEEKAEAIRCRRFEQLLNEQSDFLDKEKLRMDFPPTSSRSAVRNTRNGIAFCAISLSIVRANALSAILRWISAMASANIFSPPSVSATMAKGQYPTILLRATGQHSALC